MNIFQNITPSETDVNDITKFFQITTSEVSVDSVLGKSFTNRSKIIRRAGNKVDFENAP
jgi:hypothetical protein